MKVALGTEIAEGGKMLPGNQVCGILDHIWANPDICTTTIITTSSTLK